MRTVGYKERRKYGCWFCGDLVKRKWGNVERYVCPYGRCPYRELNEYEDYEEYMGTFPAEIKLFV